MSTLDYLLFSKAAKAAASDCIAAARRAYPGNHHTQRNVEILAVDEKGERIGDPLEYIDVKQISGKLLQRIVTNHAPAQYHSITVIGGLDCHESFREAMSNPENYEPLTDIWEVSSLDLEATQVESAERVKGSTANLSLRAENRPDHQGIFTRAAARPYN